MPVVTIDESETSLLRLLDRVEAGEDVILARGDRPIARLMPFRQHAAKREFGAMRGIISVSPAFFEPLPPVELAAWEQ